MENVIKNMNIRPMLDRAEFERVEMPKNGESVNMQITDEVKVKLIADNVVNVSLARSALSNPERLFKLYVEMSADVLIDRKYYDELKDPVEYFKKSAICGILVKQLVTLIANLTSNSAIGPVISAPYVQA